MSSGEEQEMSGTFLLNDLIISGEGLPPGRIKEILSIWHVDRGAGAGLTLSFFDAGKFTHLELERLVWFPILFEFTRRKSLLEDSSNFFDRFVEEIL